MSLWDETVGLQLSAASLAKKNACRFAVQVATHATTHCLTSEECPLDQRQIALLERLAEFLRSFSIDEYDHEDVVQTLNVIESDLESYEVDAAQYQSWHLALDSTSYALRACEGMKGYDYVAMAADAAYRSVIDVRLQDAMSRIQQRAIDEGQLKNLERSLAICREEIDYQLGLLQQCVTE